jgi:hypothetical protein
MRMLATAAMAALMVRAAFAAPVTFSGSPDNAVTLTGPGTVQWFVTNNGGTGDGTPNGACTNAPGLSVKDALFSETHGDAFDSGLTVWIDDVIFVSPDTVDVTGQTVTSGPVTLSGLEVTVEYSAMQDTPTLRTRVVLHNPTGAMISSNVRIMTPFGSDSLTTEIGSGNGGDTSRFRITADDATTPIDAVNTSIFGGPNNPHTSDFSPDYWFGTNATGRTAAGRRART